MSDFPSINLPSDGRLRLERIEAAIADLQRRRPPQVDVSGGGGDGGIEMVFNYPGALVIGRSQQFVLRKAATLVSLYVSMTAGTTDTTFVIYKNAVVIDTTIVPANTPEFEKVLAITVVEDDGISVGATSVGAGAKDVVFQIRAL